MTSLTKFPTSATTSDLSTWANTSIAWQSTTALYADDGADACITVGTFDNGIYSPALKVTNFDFDAIPVDATITGVIMRAQARHAVSSCAFQLAKLLDTSRNDAGTNVLATTSQITSTADSIISVGASTDTWGNALDVAWVKNANFGVAIGGQAQGNNCDVFIDYVTLEVCYTIAGGETNSVNVRFVET